MDTEKAYRILDAIEAFRNGSVPYEAIDSEQTAIDAATIRGRYNEIKHQMGFARAARIAKMEFMMRVVEEK